MKERFEELYNACDGSVKYSRIHQELRDFAKDQQAMIQKQQSKLNEIKRIVGDRHSNTCWHALDAVLNIETLIGEE